MVSLPAVVCALTHTQMEHAVWMLEISESVLPIITFTRPQALKSSRIHLPGTWVYRMKLK